MTKSIKAIDLFAGCGGLSLGMETAGVEVCWANENDKAAAASYRQNHKAVKLFEEDANGLLERMLRGDRDTPTPGDVDLVMGGPPCQGFSGYNRHRRADDPRNSLMSTFLGFVDYLHPTFVLLENVPGLLSLSGGSAVHILLETLAELGFSVRLGILQAGHYGVPQNRWRVFVWGAKPGCSVPSFPEPTHSFPRTTVFGATRFREFIVKPPANGRTLFWSPFPAVTVRDAIGDLPPIANGGGQDEMEHATAPFTEYQKIVRRGQSILYDHRVRRLGPVMFKRCCAIPRRPGAGWLDLPEDLKPLNLLRHGDDRYNNRFGRLHWGGTFNTILSEPQPYWGCIFHPEQDRVISVRESARAQSFPDRVRFMGPLGARYAQVGNAVPPLLARALGKELIKVLR